MDQLQKIISFRVPIRNTNTQETLRPTKANASRATYVYKIKKSLWIELVYMTLNMLELRSHNIREFFNLPSKEANDAAFLIPASKSFQILHPVNHIED